MTFPHFRHFSEMRPPDVRDRAFCVQPPETGAPLPDKLQPGLNIVTKQQALSHPPFASRAIHCTIVRKQRKFRKPPDLQFQSDCEQLLKIPFTGSTRVMTILQHQRMPKEKENLCREPLSIHIPDFKKMSETALDELNL